MKLDSVGAGAEWWAHWVAAALETERMSLPLLQADVFYISSPCCGLMGEAMACMIFQIKYKIIGSDLKNGSLQFCRRNYSADLLHFFRSRSDQKASQNCALHPRSLGCKAWKEMRPYVLVIGSPCQPFTTFRERTGKSRRTSETASDHPGHAVTFGELQEMLVVEQPHGMIGEQVDGFDKKDIVDPDTQQMVSSLDLFVRTMLEFFAGISVIKVSPKVFVAQTRTRLAVVL